MHMTVNAPRACGERRLQERAARAVAALESTISPVRLLTVDSVVWDSPRLISGNKNSASLLRSPEAGKRHAERMCVRHGKSAAPMRRRIRSVRRAR